MHDSEIIDKAMIRLWEGAGWFPVTQFVKAKRLKFFERNAAGEYRVKLKGEVLYQGRDLDRAVEVYNEL